MTAVRARTAIFAAMLAAAVLVPATGAQAHHGCGGEWRHGEACTFTFSGTYIRFSGEASTTSGRPASITVGIQDSVTGNMVGFAGGACHGTGTTTASCSFEIGPDVVKNTPIVGPLYCYVFGVTSGRYRCWTG